MRRLRVIVESILYLLLAGAVFMMVRDHASLEKWQYRRYREAGGQARIWTLELYLSRGQLAGSVEHGEAIATTAREVLDAGLLPVGWRHGRMVGGALQLSSGWWFHSGSGGFVAGIISTWDTTTSFSMPFWPLPLALAVLLIPRTVQLRRRLCPRQRASGFEILPNPPEGRTSQ